MGSWSFWGFRLPGHCNMVPVDWGSNVACPLESHGFTCGSIRWIVKAMTEAGLPARLRALYVPNYKALHKQARKKTACSDVSSFDVSADARNESTRRTVITRIDSSSLSLAFPVREASPTNTLLVSSPTFQGSVISESNALPAATFSSNGKQTAP